jgi:hypothetical protein
MNHAPEILIPDDAEGPLNLTLSADVQPLVVTAFDEDDDDLVFLWDWSPRDIPNQQQPTFRDSSDGSLWTSVLLVERDPRLNGQTIRCVATDLDLQVSVRWTVVVEDE